VDRPEQGSGRPHPQDPACCQDSRRRDQRVKVISERGTVAERLKSGEVRIERPELLRKLARAERRAAGGAGLVVACGRRADGERRDRLSRDPLAPPVSGRSGRGEGPGDCRQSRLRSRRRCAVPRSRASKQA
jgi:hypothetical protein